MKIVSTDKIKEPTSKEKIKSIGLGFVGLGFSFLPVLLIVQNEVEEPLFAYIICIQMILTIATGIGAYFFKKWGYYLLLIASNLLSAAFPIGTYFGVKLYRFIKQREVKELFSIQSAEQV